MFHLTSLFLHLLLSALGVLLIAGRPLYGQQAHTIPFQLAGKLIIVPAGIDGQPVHLIVDTGVDHLLLNARYFRGTLNPDRFSGAYGEEQAVYSNYFDLQLGELSMTDVYAEIIPLEQLEQAKQVPIHGLIGMSLLKNFEVLFDFRAATLTLFETDRRGNSAFFYLPTPSDTLPFLWKGPLPCLVAQLGKTRLNLALDTGAEINVLNVGLERRLSAALTPQERATEIISFGPRPDAQAVFALQDLFVDSWACPPVRVVFRSLNRYNANLRGPILDGIVGYDLLSSQQIGINFRKQEVYLWQNVPMRSGILVGRRP